MPKNDSVQKRDWYLDLVYKDHDFRNEVNILSDPEIKSKYHLSQEEINFFKQGNFDRGRFINRRDSLAFYTDEENKTITMTIGKDATLSDVREAWPIIRALKWSMYGKEEQRHRSPDYPEVVYAVYKLRSSGLKRSKIFDLYSKGKLLDKPYNRDRFLTAKELMDYCRPFLDQIKTIQNKSE